MICGMSFMSCKGFCGIMYALGADIFDDSLNMNIPFLLLGLGIDDAFVLTSEFRRACKLKPAASVESQIAEALRHGGMSIFITSLTDALAFLIGSMTVIPALRWFCVFAGMGIVFCFVFQVILFMPCLAINARRAETNRFDCVCCAKAASVHDVDKPQGCFNACCKGGYSPNKLGVFLEGPYGEFIMSIPGMIVIGVAFLGLTVFSIIGVCLIYKDFRIEWFLPDDSYVHDFIRVNDE